MEKQKPSTESAERYATVRIPRRAWHRVRVEAARRDMTATDVLAEKLSEADESRNCNACLRRRREAARRVA